MKRIERLHVITQDLADRSHANQARAALAAGAKWIQVRAKALDRDAYARLVSAIVSEARSFGATVIVNDDPEVARISCADGVHVGRNDPPPQDARRVLGPGAIVGATVNTKDDLERLEEMIAGAGAPLVDYLGVGPFRETNTKRGYASALGLEGMAELATGAARLGIPVVAIGGITPQDSRDLIAKGVRGVAVASAINLAADRIAVVRRFLDTLNGGES
ncbi:MAG: thiamine phosphate synthase [Thermoanaerobaculia bacterium]